MAEKTTREKIEELQFRQAEIALQKTQREISEWEAGEAARSLHNKQRQSQLATDQRGKRSVITRCNHRMGGTPKNPYKGMGDTSLKVILMPDGFTKLILCVKCPLRCWSPHPTNKSPKVRKGETAAMAKERVQTYENDLELFNELHEASQNSLSPDFTQPMDCGVTFTMTNEDGNPVYGVRPCDSYARV